MEEQICNGVFRGQPVRVREEEQKAQKTKSTPTSPTGCQTKAFSSLPLGRSHTGHLSNEHCKWVGESRIEVSPWGCCGQLWGALGSRGVTRA